MDKYGYIGIETLLDFCENSKDHSVTPNDFMRMKRVQMPERKSGHWNWIGFNIECSECGFMPNFDSTEPLYKFCPNCGAKMEGAEPEDIPMEYFESGGR